MHPSRLPNDGVKSQKLNTVTPAQAGVQKILKELNSGLRRNDNLLTYRFYVLKPVAAQPSEVHKHGNK